MYRLTLCSPPRAPRISPHRYRLLLVDHISEICKSALELPAVDGLCCFTGVFEGDTKIGPASTGGLAGLDGGCCVADLVIGRYLSALTLESTAVG